MKPCVFESSEPGVFCCTACGRVVHSRTPNVYAACGPVRQTPSVGLGDMVKAGLNAIGITQERVAAVLGSCGGCEQRQEAANSFGRAIGIGRAPDGTQEESA